MAPLVFFAGATGGVEVVEVFLEVEAGVLGGETTGVEIVEVGVEAGVVEEGVETPSLPN